MNSMDFVTFTAPELNLKRKSYSYATGIFASLKAINKKPERPNRDYPRAPVRCQGLTEGLCLSEFEEARHDASSVSYEKKRSPPPYSDSLSTVTEKKVRRAKNLKRSPSTTMLDAWDASLQLRERRAA